MTKQAYIIVDLSSSTIRVATDYNVEQFPNSRRVAGGRAVVSGINTSEIVLGMAHQEGKNNIIDGGKVHPMVDHGKGIDIYYELTRHHAVIGDWEKFKKIIKL